MSKSGNSSLSLRLSLRLFSSIFKVLCISLNPKLTFTCTAIIILKFNRSSSCVFEVFSYSVTVAVIMFYVQRERMLLLIYYIEGELKISL